MFVVILFGQSLGRTPGHILYHNFSILELCPQSISSQVTGILDREVWQEEDGGQLLTPADPDFWASNNLTTLWVST